MEPNELLLMDATVQDQDGLKVKLPQLWSKKPALFIFLRHFACIECRVLAQQMWNSKEKYESAGAELIFIGCGNSSFIQTFKEDLNITSAKVFTDPDLEVYDALGFKRSAWNSLRPSSLFNANQMKKENNIDNVKYQDGHGHIWQMGGLLAVNTSGKITYKFTSKKIGDFPEALQKIESSV